MDQQTLQELFVDHIRDMYDAEKQLVKTLPKLAKAAESDELAEALRNHQQETQNHVSRLEQAFKAMGVAARGKACKGMKGLIEEGNEAIEEHEKGSLRDLAIIAGCQKVEHYEISAYGTARALAEQLDNDQVVELLQETEEEEKKADETLTECAVAIYETEGEEDEEAGMEEEPESMAAGSARRSAAPKTRKAGGR
ncbi:MAG TPA: ferritin-like domain-containing protein [Bryobacteraceae bacterium]|jgi:ferritin-like metal-binding protein YciE|nr:ferritin-like domain-containing protein [Bryobacteraceae bacterium]